ncbi:zinc finger protein 467-like isoform X2 [Lutzomyia longipalpis]|uniref:zinc finger protein 467-like isoform X2 n=1 Tax=Lutzomyia longipalpis TaxID=7200 RepID=UPI0024835E72|nr:zinc finger protein 467-like isoform X2 [Lutzomyia longipalpis]
MDVINFKESSDGSFCRLCFTREGIFRRIHNSADVEGLNSSSIIPQLVEKHLHVEIYEVSYQVCEECCQQLYTFEKFYSKVHRKNELFHSEPQHNVSNIKTEPLEDPLGDNSGDSVRNIEEKNPHNQDEENTDFLRIVKTESGVFLPQEETFVKRIKVEEESPDEDDSAAECSKEKRFVLPTEDSEGLPKSIKLENISKSIVENGRLIVKGKELKALVNNFYDLECKLCHEKNKYKSLWILFHHYSKVHKQKGYVVCCSKKMKTQNTALMHMARHLQPEAFKCDICGYLVARPEFLENHKKTHLPEEEKPFGCDQCSQRFCWQPALKMHKLTYHPKDDRKLFPCQQCERIFVRKDALKEHMANIHEQRVQPKVQCTECKKWLANKKYLKRHMAIHAVRYPSIIESSIRP